jgi:hypothetical protein
VIKVGRGYGRACLAGALAAETCDVIVFMDGADDPAAVRGIVGAIDSGRYDFVIGSRVRGKREPGSLAGHQIFAGRAAGLLIGLLYGVLHRHGHTARHSPRHLAHATHARTRLGLESGNADAGRTFGPARVGTAGALSPPQRRAIQNCRQFLRLGQSGGSNRRHFRARGYGMATAIISRAGREGRTPARPCHVWMAPAVQEEADSSANRSRAVMYPTYFRMEDQASIMMQPVWLLALM